MRVPDAAGGARWRGGAPLEVRRDAALVDSPRDERVELLTPGFVHRWRLVCREELLPDPVRLLGRLWRAGLFPALVVAPVRQQRLVERRLEASLRVGGPEEVAAGPDVLH